MFFVRCRKISVPKRGGRSLQARASAAPLKITSIVLMMFCLSLILLVGWCAGKLLAKFRSVRGLPTSLRWNEKFSFASKFGVAVESQSVARVIRRMSVGMLRRVEINLFIQTSGSLWNQWAERAIGIINKREIIRFRFGVRSHFTWRRQMDEFPIELWLSLSLAVTMLAREWTNLASFN